MPRIVKCDTDPCFLKTDAGRGAKFCQECGASAATKVVITKKECPKCATELDDNARFCAECGTRVQTAEEGSRLAELLKNHKRPGPVTTGRGLTQAEADRIEATARAPSRVSDEVKSYVDPDEMRAHLKQSGIVVPDEGALEVELAKGRKGIVNPDGKHVTGGLSSNQSLPTSEGVRVIPYKFRNPARRGPETVSARGSSSGRGASSGRTLVTDDEADSFFVDDGPGDDVDDFFRDDPVAEVAAPRRDVTAAQAARKKAANASAARVRTEDALKKAGKRPEDLKNCHECGRIMNEKDECPWCIAKYADADVDVVATRAALDDEMSVEELESLWEDGPG